MDETSDSGPFRFVFVGDDGTFREVRCSDPEPDTLKACQVLVDGTVDCIEASIHPGYGLEVDVWINDEGRLRDDFDKNFHATRLAGMDTGWPPGASSVIVGPAVICGADSEGETLGLDEHQFETVMDLLRRDGATELPCLSVAEAAAMQRASRAARLELGHEGHGVEPFMAFVPWPEDAPPPGGTLDGGYGPATAHKASPSSDAPQPHTAMCGQPCADGMPCRRRVAAGGRCPVHS